MSEQQDISGNEKDESEKKGKSFRRIIGRFAEKTSMQGPPYINLATRTTAKAFWAIALICAIVVMALHLYLLISAYIKFPKKTSLELGFSNLVLPAVTICNVNTFKYSFRYQTPERMQRFLDKIDPTQFYSQIQRRKRKKRFADDFLAINLTGDDYSDYDTYYKDAAQDFDFNDDDDFGGTPDIIAEMNERFTDIYMDMDRFDRIHAGHQIDEMLLHCSFNGKTCHPEDFTLVQSAQYGNCYSIQSPKLKVKTSGPNSGLTLMLYMNTQEYIPGITDGYGARIQIHNINDIPFPYESGLFLASGQETSIAVRMKKITRIAKPHGDCLTDDGFKKLYQRSYSVQACTYLCDLTLSIQECGCYFEEYEDMFFNRTGFKQCDTKKDIDCMVNIREAVRNKRKICPCKQPCSETDFFTRISSRDWPTEDYANLLRNSLCEDYGDQCDQLNQLTDAKLIKNFLKVRVFYEELNFEELKEEKDIEESQFASDVGGAIGLWIGLSMLSMFEVFQLVGEILEYAVYKCTHSNNNQHIHKQSDRKQPYLNRISENRERFPPKYNEYNNGMYNERGVQNTAYNPYDYASTSGVYNYSSPHNRDSERPLDHSSYSNTDNERPHKNSPYNIYTGSRS